MKRVGRVAIPNDVLDRILELERRLDDLEGMAALPTVDPETGGDTYVEIINNSIDVLDDRYLKLDCSNDPLTASLEVQGNVNLNAAGAELQIEGDHALSLEDSAGNRTNVLLGAGATNPADVATSVIAGDGVFENSDTLSDIEVTGSIVLGYRACYNTNDDSDNVNYLNRVVDAVIIGRNAAHDADRPDWSVIIGPGAAYEAHQATDVVVIGKEAGYRLNKEKTGSYLQGGVYIGSWAARWIDNDGVNTAVGWRCLGGGATGTPAAGTHQPVYCTVMGFEALGNATEPDRVVAIGEECGLTVETSDSVLLAGYRADVGQNNTNYAVVLGAYAVGHDNSVLVGFEAGNTGVTGDYNTGVGTYALTSLTSGYENATYGDYAGYSITEGYENCLFGSSAADDITTGYQNLVAGHYAGASLTTQHGCVFLGHNAGYNETNSERLYIANSDTATPLIYGEFDNDVLAFHANTAETATIHDLLTLSHVTSGTAAALFGVAALHELEDGAGNAQDASEVATLWADATSGSESPLRRWTTYPAGSAGPGYAGFWTWDGVDDTSVTVIPNGAGDVTGIIQINYAVVEVTGGGTSAGTANVTPGNTVDIYTDGTDTLTVSVAADGSVTISRTAGADTFQVSLLMNWV